MMNDGYYNWGMSWGFPFMGPLFFILFIIGGIYFFRIILKDLDREKDGRTKPIDILKLRYARGEIDQATFEQMKTELE